jgi:hypothetical protein
MVALNPGCRNWTGLYCHEAVISFVLSIQLLTISRSKRWQKLTTRHTTIQRCKAGMSDAGSYNGGDDESVTRSL